MLSSFKPQRMFRANNIAMIWRGRQLQQMKAHRLLNTHHGARYMATETQNYFKRVLQDHVPQSHKRYNAERDETESAEYFDHEQRRGKKIIQDKLNQQRFGIKDYHLHQINQDPFVGQQTQLYDISSGRIPKDQIEANRYQLEIVDQLIPNIEVAAFNIPFDTTTEELHEIFSKFGSIENIEIHENLSLLPSYAVITFKSHKGYEKCLKNPTENWIRYSLLKLRGYEDAKLESVRNRTVAISNLPDWATEDHLLSLASRAGTVLKIDMPMTDRRYKEDLNQQLKPEVDKKMEKTYEDKMKVIDDILAAGNSLIHNPQTSFQQNYENYQNPEENKESSTLAEKILNYEKDLYKSTVFQNKVSHMPPTDLRVLNKEKRLKVLTLCTMVYNENQLVSDTLQNIKLERDGLVARLNNVMEYPDLPGTKEMDSYISAEQIQAMKNYLTYIERNHESLPPEVLSEIRKNKIFNTVMDYYKNNVNIPNKAQEVSPLALEDGIQSQIANAHVNVVQELATGYDWLLTSLEKREKILKHRLDRLLKDYGKFDRVLTNSKDFNNDPEDIHWKEKDTIIRPPGGEMTRSGHKDLESGDNQIKLDEIISVSEQMQNIYNFKRTHRHDIGLQGKRNPFEDDMPNFSLQDLETAKINEKTVHLIDKRIAASTKLMDLTRLKNNQSMYNNYDDEVLAYFSQKINHARNQLDTPFDELYHKEKSLIDNVVQAEKELNEAKQDMENQFKQDDEIQVLVQKDSTVEDTAETLFEKDRRIKNSYSEALRECFESLSNGYVSKMEKIFNQEVGKVNIGHCFITFTHTDDAKKFLMGKKELYLESHRLIATLKKDMDHGDFIYPFVKDKIVADARILDKFERLRKVKKELKDYEDSLESHMPQTFKLLQMKEAAREAIDGNYTYNRNSFPRSQLENERLHDKIKQTERRLQTDLSPLMDSREKEKERVARHRKAFDTYKSYAFLKSGLKKTSLEKRLTDNAEEEVANQYKFPSPDKVAKVFLNDDYRFSMLKEGEENTKPGRKFKFTPRDFIEKYYGKDMSNMDSINLTERPIYSFNDELKNSYPVEAISLRANMVRLQKFREEENMKRYNIHADEKSEKSIDAENLYEKRLIMGKEKTTYIHQNEPNLIINSTKTYDERLEGYAKRLLEKDKYGKPKTRMEHLRPILRDENFKDMKDEKVIFKKLKKKFGVREIPMDKEGNPKKGFEIKRDVRTAPDPSDPAEKWNPADESDGEDIQELREKVYTDYLDTIKKDALESDQPDKFNNAEKDFFEKYRKAVIEPNKDERKGDPYKPKTTNSRYSNLIADRQEIYAYKERRDRLEAHPDTKDPKDVHATTSEFNKWMKQPNPEVEELNEEIKVKFRETTLREFDLYKTQERKENEKFLYRHEYAEDHKDLQDKMEPEETLEFKVLKESATTKFDFNETMKHSKNVYSFSENKSSTAFTDKLLEGSIPQGIKEREKLLGEVVQDKDLFEIAGGDEPKSQNIHKQYTKTIKSGLGDGHDESIKDREKAFLDALEKEQHQKYTFQQYEDYKRARELEKLYDENNSTEDIIDSKNAMTRREYLAKLWSGKLSHREFQEYNYDEVKSKDKFGFDVTTMVEKSFPGYGSEEYIDRKEMSRIITEEIEAKRRFAVQHGMVTEADSYNYIEEFLEDQKEKMKIKNTLSYRRLWPHFMQIYSVLEAGNNVREYYFDPNQGITLEEHIEGVKRITPNAKIDTYVDRDGFTVVKKTINKQYTFDLDKLMAMNPAKYNQKIKSQLDEYIEEIVGKCEDEEQLFGLLNDNKIQTTPVFKEIMAANNLEQMAIDQPKLFVQEISEQIRIKTMRHMYLKKIEEDDLLKTKQPETIIKHQLQRSIDNSIDLYENVIKENDEKSDYLKQLKLTNKEEYEKVKDDEDHQVMSKEEYNELRKQIKERKEAKAKLIKQGFPKLKNYVYL